MKSWSIPKLRYCCLQFFASLVLLFLLPNCARVVHWGKERFGQIDKVAINICPACAYVRTVHLYDLFNNAAYFDVLWLSNTVRRVYSELYALEKCKKSLARDNFFSRQLQENNYTISFYLLMPQDKEHTLAYDTITGLWSVSLLVDGICYTPLEIKAIELAPEYRRIFGNRYNIYKTPYLIQFDAHDNSGNYILKPSTRVMTLQFVSPWYSTDVKWVINGLQCIQSDPCAVRSTLN